MFAKWDFVRLEIIQLGKRVYYRAYPNRAERNHCDTTHMVGSDHSEGPDGSCHKQGLNAENFKANSISERPQFPLISYFKEVAVVHKNTATKRSYKGIFFFLFSPVYSPCGLTALCTKLVSLLAVFHSHTIC